MVVVLVVQYTAFCIVVVVGCICCELMFVVVKYVGWVWWEGGGSLEEGVLG